MANQNENPAALEGATGLGNMSALGSVDDTYNAPNLQVAQAKIDILVDDIGCNCPASAPLRQIWRVEERRISGSS